MAKSRGRNVPLSTLIREMQQIIQEGNQDVKANVQTLAERIGLTPDTTKQKMSQAKKKYPQLQLMELQYFFATTGPPADNYTPEEMNRMLAEILNKPVKEVEKEAEKLVAQDKASVAS